MAETLSVPVTLTALTRVYDWIEAVADRCDLPRGCRVALQVVAEEVVSNIVRHGFQRRPPASTDVIRLTLEADAAPVLLTVEDSATPFDPRQVAEPARASTLEDTVAGGNGLPMIRRRTLAMDYEFRDGVNRLRLTLDRDPPRPRRQAPTGEGVVQVAGGLVS